MLRGGNLIGENMLHFSDWKVVYTKLRRVDYKTHFCSLDAGAKTPCLGSQVKYRTPSIEPSFFPIALESSTPYQIPEENDALHIK